MNQRRIDHLVELIEKRVPTISEDCDVVMKVMYRWGFMSSPRLQLHTKLDEERSKYSLIYLSLMGELRKGKDGVTYMLNRA